MNTTKTNPHKIDPAALAPDFDNLPEEHVGKRGTFWMGLTKDCPLGQIDVAGLHFPGYNEVIGTDNAGRQTRHGVIGALNSEVTRTHFDELVKVMPRLVVRFERLPKSALEQPEDDKVRRRALLIKIPDEAMIAGATAHGRTLKPYRRMEGDRPASEFMFFHHAPLGVRGLEYQTIAEVGLEWPFTDEAEPKAALASGDATQPKKPAAATT